QHVSTQLRQNTCCLRSAHNGNTGIGPAPQKTWIKGAATHAVVAGTKAAANQRGDFGNTGRRNSVNKFGAMFGDAFMLVFLAHHKTGDVLQEQQWNIALAAELYKVHTLEC